MPSETFKNICQGIFAIVATLGIIFGGVWGVHEFYSLRNEKRILATQDYVSEMFTGNAKDSEQWMIKFWSEIDKDKYKKFPADERIIKVIDDHPQYSFHIKNLLNFLDSMRVCIEMQICHEETAINTFSGLFDASFKRHYSWILSQRKLHPTYFVSLECFMKDRNLGFKTNVNCF